MIFGQACGIMPNYMDEEKSQKELFEFEKPKRSFPKLSNFLPKADFERNILITLSLDKVIFISIGLILLMVVVYALGVEIGKSRAAERIVPQVSAKKEIPLPVKTAKVFSQITPVLQVPGTAAIPRNPARPYVIVAGTYTRKDNAMATMTRLRQGGLDAYIGQSQPFFQVWIVFKTSAYAVSELNNVRIIYKDAYLKQR